MQYRIDELEVRMRTRLRAFLAQVQRTAPVVPTHVYAYAATVAIEIVLVVLTCLTASGLWGLAAGEVGFVVLMWTMDFPKDYQDYKDTRFHWSSHWMHVVADAWRGRLCT